MPAETPALLLILGYWVAGFSPAAPAAVHGDYVCVAHFLEIVGGECGAEAAAAIEDYRRVVIGDGFFDVALDYAFAEMDRAGDVAVGPFEIFAGVNEYKFLAGIDALFYFFVVHFLHAALCILHQLQKSF